jgi:hypothetical protein
MRVERFPVFAPVALAGIAGGMPATITTRAITIHMRRRAPHEQAEPFRERRVESEAAPLRESLAVWLDRVGADQLAGAEPALPDGVTDRAAEVWEPLLALAEVAGGHWPDTARAAASHFVSTARTAGASIGTRLLADLHTVFRDNCTDRMTSVDTAVTSVTAVTPQVRPVTAPGPVTAASVADASSSLRPPGALRFGYVSGTSPLGERGGARAPLFRVVAEGP